MELKRLLGMVLYSVACGSNRTFMELKPNKRNDSSNSLERSNRTFMELKQHDENVSNKNK